MMMPTSALPVSSTDLDLLHVPREHGLLMIHLSIQPKFQFANFAIRAGILLIRWQWYAYVSTEL